MTIIMEAEHILGDSTPAAFAKYVEVYGETAIRAMNDVGFNLLGAWRQTTGPLGRDLLLSSTESMAAMEALGPKLFQHDALVEGLPRLMGLGFTLDEIAKNAVTLACADDRRLRQGVSDPDAAPRCYRLIRRRVGFAGMQAASDAIAELADGLEAAGSWKLFTAYQTTTGDRGEISEMWIAPDITREWYPPAAPAEPLAALDAVTRQVSMHILDPLPYSKAR